MNETPPQQPGSAFDVFGVEVPPGAVMAVFRSGRYVKALKPGRAWPFIHFQPLVDRFVLIDTRPRRRELTFQEIYSLDRVALDITMVVEYSFDPSDLPQGVAAEILSFTEQDRANIVYVRILRALRELVGITPAETLLINPTAANLEPDLYLRIYNYLNDRGFKFHGSESITITDVERTFGEPVPEPEPPHAGAPAREPPTEATQVEQPTAPMMETTVREEPVIEEPPRKPDDTPEEPEPPPEPRRPGPLRRTWRKRTPPPGSDES